MKEIIIRPDEYGIEDQKANQLIGNLPQILSERDFLTTRFDEVIRLDIEDNETTKKAKDLRILIQKNRTKGIQVWHKTTKDFFLKGGQFVDAIKRKEVAINERMESELFSIEKHAEIKEKERLEKVQIDRSEKLSQYVDDCNLLDLSGMQEDVWEAYYETKKKQFEERIEADKKAEQERVEKEKAEAIERERVRIENERLKKEAKEREEQIRIKEAKRAEEERKEREKAEAERKKIEAENKKKQKEFEDKLKKEREEKERLEKEIKAKAEEERKAKEEEEKARQKELEKGDEEKAYDLISELQEIKYKYKFDSNHHKKLMENVKICIDRIIESLGNED